MPSGCTDSFNCPRVGWNIVDVMSAPVVHVVTPAHDLSMMQNNSISEIYASHILEHFSVSNIYRDYNNHSYSENELAKEDCELCNVLKEWHRVLLPDGSGKIYLSVPDMIILGSILSDPKTSPGQLSEVINMIFGAQKDKFDIHKMGYHWLHLKNILERFGFCNISNVSDFGELFNDCSLIKINERFISLNVIAYKCIAN